MLEDLSSTEAQGGIPDQQLGDEILRPICDVSPVPVWKLILAMLDAFKQMTLRKVEEVLKVRRTSEHFDYG